MTILYTKQGNKLRQWRCFTDGVEVVVVHGQVGGKQVEKRYTAEPTNVGRSNERDSVAQAAFEVQAKIDLQLKRSYYRTQEEAINHVDFTPMKCLDFKDHAKKVVYPCYISAKLDGFRMMVDKNGQAWSKQGEPLDFPAHWDGLKEVLVRVGGGDGEVYCKGMPLQSIRSAYLTPQEATKKLEYWVYDVPVAGESFEQRRKRLYALSTLVSENNLTFVKVIPGVKIYDDNEADLLYNKHVSDGYEGSVYRNSDGVYDFGKRSSGMFKRKPRPTNEALVLSYTLDKNDEPVYTGKALNGEQEGVVFKFKMKIPKEGTNYRRKENADELIGKTIEYAWENLSKDRVPCKPVGLCIREVRNGEGRF